MRFRLNIENPADFKSHWNNFQTCDFCGQQTRGRIYANDINKHVYCGSCHGRLIDGEKDDMPKMQKENNGLQQ